MSSNSFGGSGSLQKIQLRHDRDRLQIDAERPEDFHDRELVVDQQGQKKGRDQKEFNAKSVMIAKIEVY
jgi:hypothetical protein